MRQHNFVRFEYTKKWAILRGQFLREVRRERCSSHKSGWRWYPKLEFLKSDEILFEKRVKSKTDTIMLSSPYNNTNNNNTNNNNNTKRKMIEPPHFPKRRHMLEVIAKPLYPPTMTKLPLQQTPKPPLQQQQQPPPIIHHDEGVRIEYITPSFIERKDDHRRPSLENTRHPTPPLQPSSTPLLASAPASANNHNHNNNHKPSTRIHTPPQQQQEHNSINNNTNNNSNNSDDQESLFGKMVASTLRKFTSYQRVVARKKIQDLLFEIELQNAADVDNNVK